LDVIDSGAGSFGDFFKQAVAAGSFVVGEGYSVCDVVQKAMCGQV
jgi:hypothetical protein